MSSLENNCQWHFAELGENAGDKGPNSTMSQTFSQFPCSTLVRESIQNSLDAVIDVPTLDKISKLLDVSIKDLLVDNR